MRRWFGFGVALLVILAGVAIGVGAYHAGYNHGLVNSGHVREVVVGPGYGDGFPFGFLFFPLFFIGLFLLLRGAAWRRGWRGGPWGHHGPGSPEGQQRIEEWHNRLHEQATGDHPGSGGEPATA